MNFKRLRKFQGFVYGKINWSLWEVADHADVVAVSGGNGASASTPFAELVQGIRRASGWGRGSSA
jgi:hypothetical protein